MRTVAAFAAFFIGVMPAISFAQPVDGDTLVVEGRKWRLWGIDSPELRQTCDQGWPAGRVAKAFLADQIRGRPVACEFRALDRYGRSVGLCRVDGMDLGDALVRAGLAHAYVRYSGQYLEAEWSAKAAKEGVHRFNCLPAWIWRKNR